MYLNLNHENKQQLHVIWAEETFISLYFLIFIFYYSPNEENNEDNHTILTHSWRTVYS